MDDVKGFLFHQTVEQYCIPNDQGKTGANQQKQTEGWGHQIGIQTSRKKNADLLRRITTFDPESQITTFFHVSPYPRAGSHHRIVQRPVKDRDFF